ncbi:MAG: hypothetical protein WCP35_21975 [Verrucomicrobiota bacterium]
MHKPQTQMEWARERQITARFGLTHMILFTLRKAKKIRSVSLKVEGKSQGARLFNVASIEAFLARQEDRENQGE